MSTPKLTRGYSRLEPPIATIRTEKLTNLTTEISGKHHKEHVGDAEILKHMILDQMNVFLIGVPAAIVAVWQEWGDAPVFGCCFLGLLPLAKMLGDATEHIAESLNQTIGGLLNATFGNAVEMIITIELIKEGLLETVKKSLLGSILSNLLLVLGMAFFAGGLVRQEQEFSGAAALINVTMLFVGIMSFSLPTIFSMSASQEATLKISRVSAIFVAIGYIAYLVFQLGTHTAMFEDEEDEEEKVELCSVGCGRPAVPPHQTCCQTCLNHKGAKHGPKCQEAEDEREAPEKSVLSLPWALLVLIVCTVIVAILSELMVDSIGGVVTDVGIPQAFVGVILLPIVGNACEHASAVRMAYHNKVATAIAIAVGSSTQIALLVMPFSVLTAWFCGQPLDLDMHPTGLAVLFLSVLVVFSIVMDAKSNWLEGFMLVLSYCLVAVLYWYTETSPENGAESSNHTAISNSTVK